MEWNCEIESSSRYSDHNLLVFPALGNFSNWSSEYLSRPCETEQETTNWSKGNTDMRLTPAFNSVYRLARHIARVLQRRRMNSKLKRRELDTEVDGMLLDA